MTTDLQLFFPHISHHYTIGAAKNVQLQRLICKHKTNPRSILSKYIFLDCLFLGRICLHSIFILLCKYMFLTVNSPNSILNPRWCMSHGYLKMLAIHHMLCKKCMIHLIFGNSFSNMTSVAIHV